MALGSDVSELLSGFEKRMKFINIVRCLLDYKYPDNIRAMIPDKKILDNICLTDNGICLSYLYEVTHNMEQKINSISQSNNIYLDNIQNSNSKVLIYKKC